MVLAGGFLLLIAGLYGLHLYQGNALENYIAELRTKGEKITFENWGYDPSAPPTPE